MPRRSPVGRSATAIPEKEFFKIGEAARLVGVEPYVLRYWETEFAREIKPERSRGNQRVYRRRDLEVFLRIKALRYDERLKIIGAKRRMRVQAGEELAPGIGRLAVALEAELRDLVRIVDDDAEAD